MVVWTVYGAHSIPKAQRFSQITFQTLSGTLIKYESFEQSGLGCTKKIVANNLIYSEHCKYCLHKD